MNILDVAENSVRAGASLVSVLLDFKDDATLVLSIDDNGSGMDEAVLRRVEDPFFTSRTTRKVGFGVPFLKMAAELTGGGFAIESAVGTGTSVTAVFNTEHIDMIPLGGIGSTLSALISGSPGTDFTCVVRRGGSEFLLDSREIKSLLDGVPVESPDVAVFIREYAEENILALLDGTMVKE